MALSRIDWPALELLFFSSELTLRELAERTGVPFGTIGARASRHQWQARKEALRRGELPANKRPPDSPYAPELLDANDAINTGEPGNMGSEQWGITGEPGHTELQTDANAGRKRITATEMLQTAQTVIASEAEAYRQRMARQARRLPRIMEAMPDEGLLAIADRLDKLDKLNRRTLELDTAKQQQQLIQIDILSSLKCDPLFNTETVLEVSSPLEFPGEETVLEPVLLS